MSNPEISANGENPRPSIVQMCNFCDASGFTIAERVRLFLAVYSDLQPEEVSKNGAKLTGEMLVVWRNETLHAAEPGVDSTSLEIGDGEERPLLESQADSDVSVFGAILFRLLTGTNTDAALFAAFRPLQPDEFSEESQRPSVRLSKNLSLPGIARQRQISPDRLVEILREDLDWILLKCAGDKRTGKYESLAEQQQDLRRFLLKQPVQARPASWIYQLRKFRQRQSSLLNAVAGIAVSIILAFLFTRETHIEPTPRENESQSGAKTSSDADRNLSDEAIRTLLQTMTDKGDPSDEELLAILKFSQQRDTTRKLRVLELALSNPQLAMKAAYRADHFIHACVGLSRGQRAAAIELLSQRQQDSQADPAIRIAACWLAVSLASQETPALAELLQWHLEPTEHFIQGRDAHSFDFAKSVRSAIGAMSPRQHAVLKNELLKALEDIRDRETVRNGILLAQAIKPLLTDNERLLCCKRLVAIMLPTKKKPISQSVGDEVVMLAADLSAEPKAELCELILSILESATSDEVICLCVNMVVQISPELSEVQFLRVWSVLESAPAKCRPASSLLYPGSAYVGTSRTVDSQRLPASLANRLTQEMVDTIASSIPDRIRTAGPSAIEMLVDLIEAMQARFSGEQADAICDSIVVRLNSSNAKSDPGDVFRTVRLCRGLHSLCDRISTTRADAAWQDAIVLQFRLTSNPWSENRPYSGLLGRLARRMPADRVGKLWERHQEILAASTNRGELDLTKTGLLELAPSLNSEQRIATWNTLWERLIASGDDDVRSELKHGISWMVSHLPDEHLWVAWTQMKLMLDRPELSDLVTGTVLCGIANRLPAQHWPTAKSALLERIDPDRASEHDEIGWLVVSCVGNRFNEEERRQIFAWAVRNLEQSSTELNIQNPASKLETEEFEARRFLSTWKRTVISSIAVGLSESGMQRQKICLELLHRQFAQDAFSGFADSLVMVRLFFDETRYGHPVAQTIAATNEPRLIAELLRHPAAVGMRREWLLMRLEELVFHQGEHVFLEIQDPNQAATSIATADEPSRLDRVMNRSETPKRRFQTIWNAVDWIETHWPDFVLDTLSNVAMSPLE